MNGRTLHKTPPARKNKRKNPVVEVSATHDFVGRRGVHYSVTYQRELVKCGKPKCRKWHGPYWYAYWTEGTRTRTLYIGKILRPAADVLTERSRRRPAEHPRS